MALKERKVVLVSKDAEGNTCMDMPLTTVDQVEGAVQSVNGSKPDSTGNVAITIPEQVNADWNATSGAAQILNKPTIPANPEIYVTDFWRSGKAWYRKWSNGFIEQGGQEGNLSNNKRIQFNTNFSTTNIIVLMQTTHPTDTSGWAPSSGPGAVKNVTTSYFTLGSTYDNGTNYKRNWIAFGY